jgi:hypothetical protein
VLPSTPDSMTDSLCPLDWEDVAACDEEATEQRPESPIPHPLHLCQARTWSW